MCIRDRPQISAGARAWLVLLLMLLGPTVGLLCTAFGPVRRLLSRSLDRVCGARLPPTARARGVVTALCGFGCAGGLGVCAMGVYALTPAGATDALLSTAGNASCIAGGALWALASARATRAAWRMERRWLFAFGVLATGVLLVFLALFSTILHWAAALEAAGDFALETLGPPVGANATIGRWHGQVGSASLARVEAVVCGAYVSCCAPDAGGVNDILAFSAADVLAASGAQSACLSPFAGLRGAPVDAGAASSPSSSYASDTNLTAAQVAFIDPSARPFCEYVSGSPRAGSVTAGACDSLQTHVLGFDVGTCRADFCAAGVDGYAHFLATAFTAVRERAAWIGALLFLGGLCQVVQIASTFALVSATARLKFAARRGSAGVRPLPSVPLPQGPSDDPIWLKARREPMPPALGGPLDNGEADRHAHAERARARWRLVRTALVPRRWREAAALVADDQIPASGTSFSRRLRAAHEALAAATGFGMERSSNGVVRHAPLSSSPWRDRPEFVATDPAPADVTSLSRRLRDAYEALFATIGFEANRSSAASAPAGRTPDARAPMSVATERARWAVGMRNVYAVSAWWSSTREP